MNVRISITQVQTAVKVVIQQVGAPTTTIITAQRPASMPWSAITGKPDNLTFAAIDDEQLNVELRGTDGELITKVPYRP